MINGEIPGVMVRPLLLHSDARGWLCELFRDDELTVELRPQMVYVSSTRPGVSRGPHEHRTQHDLFCFLGSSTFRLYLWDNRTNAANYRKKYTADFGPDNPTAIVVPRGVVHAYVNVGTVDGLVFNAPSQLYAGENRAEPIDEVRWESDPNSPFKLESDNR